MKSKKMYETILNDRYDVYEKTSDGLSKMLCLRELDQKFINYLEFDGDLDDLNVYAYNDLEQDVIDFNNETRSLFDELYEIILDVNMKKGWHFDINPVDKLHRFFYDIGRDRNDAHFDVYHMDWNPQQIPFRKISMSVQLSDSEDYDGGDLKLMYGFKEHTIPKKKGTIAIWPSFILHKVEPVTRGRRTSLVGWYEGDSSFR